MPTWGGVASRTVPGFDSMAEVDIPIEWEDDGFDLARMHNAHVLLNILLLCSALRYAHGRRSFE